MQQAEYPSHDPDSYVSIFREVVSSARDLAQSELRLAKAEMSEGIRSAAASAVRGAVAAAFLFASLIPLSGFLALGAGELLGSLLLGSLAVFGLYALIGGVLAVSLAAKLKKAEPFAQTKEILERHLDDGKRNSTETHEPVQTDEPYEQRRAV